MLRNSLHRILFTTLLMLIGGWAVVAQQYVEKGSTHRFSVEKSEGADYVYHWTVAILDQGTTQELKSTSNITEEFTFEEAGAYEISVYPVDKQTGCYGEAKTFMVIVPDGDTTAKLAIVGDDVVCSESSWSGGEQGVMNFKVTYNGPKPWSFSYSLDEEPQVIPQGADAINDDDFYFEISLRNEQERTVDHSIEVFAQGPGGIAVADDPDNHERSFRVLALPQPVWSDYNKLVRSGSNQIFTVTVKQASEYEVIIPEGVTLLNEDKGPINTETHTRDITFEVQWPQQTGDYSIKFLESNAMGCYSDITYADVKVVNGFFVSLGGDQQICADQTLELDASVNIPGDYTYKWNTDDNTSSITVTETGDYEVTVSDGDGNEATDKIHVDVYPLPIVDLGDDVVLYDGESKELDAGDAGEGSSYLWSTGDLTQKITVSEQNLYWVEVTTEQGCSNRGEVNVTRREGHFFSVYLGGDKTICKGDKPYLEPTIDRNFQQEPTYRWIPSESTEKGIYVEKGGKYCVEVTDPFGNTEGDCMTLTVNPTPEIELGEDLTLPVGQLVVLDAGNPGSVYTWSTGELTQTITIDDPAQYWVEVINSYNCMARDTVTVEYEEDLSSDVVVPTGFSPNGDQLNDILYVRGKNIASMDFIVVNRLGQRVFQSNRQEVGWDGTYHGEKQDMDTYVYILKVTFHNGKTIHKRGNITLLY